MQIKLVNTITKWCIWPVGVESKLHVFLIEEMGEEICPFLYAQVKKHVFIFSIVTR